MRDSAGRPGAGERPGSARRRVRAVLTMLAVPEESAGDVVDRLAADGLAALPSADGLGFVVGQGRGREVMGTSAAVSDLDLQQLRLGEGPAVAAGQGATVLSADLTDDPRWPRLAAARGPGGLRSALSLPLVAPTGCLGVLSVYATAPGLFGEAERERATRLAAETAPVVAAALAADQERRAALEQRLSVAEQVLVDRAVLVLGREEGLGPDEALAVLRTAGQSEGSDLVTAARGVLASARRGA